MTPAARSLLAQGAAKFGVTLSAGQLDAFARFAAELQKWNRKINLTAITTDEEIVLKHFVDSLSICPLIGEAASVLDLGSGGGFPIIPLKLVRTGVTAFSVDAVEKKILFQRHIGRLLDLTDFTPLHARGEDLAERYAGRFDWVVSRAFADLPTFARMALPLCAAQGRLLAMKGQGGRDEVTAAEASLAALGVVMLDLVEFSLPHSGDRRSLICLGRSESVANRK